MKWFSHLAAMTFGIGFLEVLHNLGLSHFGGEKWLEGVLWLMMSTVFILGHLYEKHKAKGGSPPPAL